MNAKCHLHLNLFIFTISNTSELQSAYEHKLSEWGALEAIVQQNDR